MQKAFYFFLCCAAMVPQLNASCGSASCPLNNHRYLHAGFLMIRYSREYINQDRIYVGSRLSFIGAIPYHHDEVQTINERSAIGLQAGITERLGLTVEIPFVSRQHSHIHHHMGSDIWESWNYTGLGDIILTGQFALVIPESEFDPSFVVVGGAKLPTGVTNAANVEGEEAEIAIQPGSGSTDGIAGFYFRQTIATIPTLSGASSALPIDAGISYQVRGRGKYNWRFGNTLLVHVGTSYQFSSHANLLLQFNGRIQGRADVGLTGEPGENTGGTFVYVSPGLNIDLLPSVSAYGYLQVPLYQNVNGIQQTSRYNLQFGISATVGLLGS